MGMSTIGNYEYRNAGSGCLFDTSTDESRQIKIISKIASDETVTTIYTEADGTEITLTATQTVTQGDCVEVDLVLGSALPICIEEPAGTFTQGFLREVHIVDNTDGGSSVVTEYTLNGTAWSTTVPTGTIVLGECPLEVVPQTEIDVTYSNWLPVCIGNVQWYIAEKLSVENDTGTETVTKVYKEGADGTPTDTAPVGIQTQGYCTDADLTYDTEVGCLFDSATQVSRAVKIVDTIDENGDVTSEYTEVDGTAITLGATETVTQGPCRPLVVVTHDEPGCADSVPYTRRRLTYFNGSGVIVTTVDSYFDSSNVETTTMPTNFRLGACLDIVEATEPYGQDYLGIIPAVFPVTSPVRSVTISVYVGNVVVVTPNGTLTIESGSSFTWNSGTKENIDVSAMTFTGSATNTKYILHGEKVA